MSHSSDNELISAYLDGELTGDEQKRIEQLLARSPEARQLADDFRALRATLQSLPPHAPGREFSARVVRLAERRSAARSPAPAAKSAAAKAPAAKPESGLPSIDVAKPLAAKKAAQESVGQMIVRALLRPRNLVWAGLAAAVALALHVAEMPSGPGPDVANPRVTEPPEPGSAVQPGENPEPSPIPTIGPAPSAVVQGEPSPPSPDLPPPPGPIPPGTLQITTEIAGDVVVLFDTNPATNAGRLRILQTLARRQLLPADWDRNHPVWQQASATSVNPGAAGPKPIVIEFAATRAEVEKILSELKGRPGEIDTIRVSSNFVPKPGRQPGEPQPAVESPMGLWRVRFEVRAASRRASPPAAARP